MSQGSVEEFKANWQRPEAEYCHFTRGEPENQIQFAFRQNWLAFKSVGLNAIDDRDKRKCLEVGAGRGTMSMYFADAGFNCTLLDADSSILSEAKRQFEANGLHATTITGDAMAIPKDEPSYDVVFSYGLLEHFRDVFAVVAEQCRVLKQGGLLLAYVVPGRPNERIECAAMYDDALAHYGAMPKEKHSVYRNGHSPEYYEVCFREAGLRDVFAAGVYPLPMVSPNNEFPFTLNPPDVELKIVRAMNRYVEKHGWRCKPHEGQAFIVWGWKQ